MRQLPIRMVTNGYGRRQGRIQWDRSVRDQVLAKWVTPEGRQTLLDANFAHASGDYFDKAIVQLKRLLSRLSWP